MYDPLAKTLHRFRDVVFPQGKRYTAPKAADEEIWNEHFCRDVIEQPEPIEKQPTECQTETLLDDDPPRDPPQPMKNSGELIALEASPGDAWMLPAEGRHWNRAGMDMLGESVQLAIKDDESYNMIPIYTAAAISHDYEDGIDDPMNYKAATESPLGEQWDMAMNEEFDAIGQHQVFGDFMVLPEGIKDLPCHWIYKIKRDGAGNVQWFKARLVCGGNHQIEGINYQATYAPNAHSGPMRPALAITAKYDLVNHQKDVCPALLGVDLQDEIYMHPLKG